MKEKMKEKLAWERMKGETGAAFEAFQIYLLLSPRSITGVAQECNKNRSLIARWSAKWEWVRRASLYDEDFWARRRQVVEQERLTEVERLSSVAAMSRRAQELLAKQLETFDPAILSPMDMINWFEKASKLERTTMDELTKLRREEEDERERQYQRQRQLRVDARMTLEESAARYPTIPLKRRRKLVAKYFGIAVEELD